MNDPWVERWLVPRSDGEGDWVVSRKLSGSFGCSCPVWKFSKEKDAGGNVLRDAVGNVLRKECHHIRQIRGRTDAVTSAEVMVRMASLGPREACKLLEKAYLKAGYMSWGYVSVQPEDWEKARVDELKHNPDLSLVCLRDGNFDKFHLMVKKLR